VVTSNVSSLPEVGGDAVAYVDPHDTRSIAAGLRRVLDDRALRERLARSARLRAAEFSWERFAQIALDTLTGVATDRRQLPNGEPRRQSSSA